jgi:choline kinase
LTWSGRNVIQGPFYQCFSKKGRSKVKVVILGAGQGKRLLPLTEEVPKALLDIGGKRLIEWQIDAFREAGATEFVVVTGYRADVMAQFLAGVEQRLGGIAIRTVYNPFYSVADNLASCWMAREEMVGDFIQVNGDNLFRAGMVEELLASPPAPVTVAIGHKPEYDSDDMKVMLDGDRLTEIGKTLPLEAVDAESIGMILFRDKGPRIWCDMLERAMADPSGLRQWYLSAIGALAKTEDIRVRSVDGHVWCEVDFPVDLQHARHLVADW